MYGGDASLSLVPCGSTFVFLRLHVSRTETSHTAIAEVFTESVSGGMKKSCAGCGLMSPGNPPGVALLVQGSFHVHTAGQGA